MSLGSARSRLFWVLLVAGALTVMTLRLVPAEGAGPCDAPVTNPIACENSKPGNPSSEWNIPTADAGDPDIQGYAAAISVDQGQTVQFKVKTPATDYRLDIYRLGYYGGLGARKITTVQPSATLPQTQPACLTNASLGLVDCGNWAVSASWSVPADAVSGVYVAKLVREDGTTGVSHIVFIVRDDDGHSPLLFKTSDTTWQAYNSYGGASLYRDFQFGLPAGRAYKVSYNRPINTRSDIDGLGKRSFLFNAEYPMIRWLEANGYNVSYFTGVDTASRGAEILEHDAFLSVGHDEYWSGEERTNVETARNSGVDLAFFSGNEVFWKTRWENSIDGANTPYDTLVSYKETKANAKIDPSPLWTGTWRDPRFSPPSDGGRPENALTGTIFTVNGPRSDTITVPAEYGNLRFWRNTNIATLQPGQVATLTSGSLGHEWDEDLDNGSRPAGLMGLSSTSVTLNSHLVDYGNTYTPGTATHSLTLYRHSSGALVFGAGTVQWSWGLDANHDRGVSTPDPRMQQATVNLFADMGVQPGSLQAGLVPATASSDATAPTSTITSPLPGATIANSPVTITGTATDSGGGVVAGVEVSVDGGATWHPATGRNNWSYSWAPSALGATNIKSRAFDDSANIEAPGAGINVNVTFATPTCPCTIWPSGTTPAVASHSSTTPWELGVKFKSDFDGYITGVRFYKGTANTGTHAGSLWSSTGTLLASVTFTGETASGWQQALFSAPVAVTAGTTYVASYHTDTGGFAFNDAYFSVAGFDRWPLHAPANGVAGGNGVFKSGASGFPNQSYNASNYWVDVVFNTTAVDTLAPSVTDRSPAPGGTNVSTLTNVTAIFSEPVTPGSISFQLRDASNALVPAAVSYDAATRTATLDPNATLVTSKTYTATVSGAADAAGNVMAPVSWSFSTQAATLTCPCSIWASSATPAVASYSSTQPWELGVKFKSDFDGYISGVRFYKGAANTGTHTGSLWSSAGTLLGSVTFTGETASGWQQALFSAPVAVTAGTTYVASYHTDTGGFSLNDSYFNATGIDNSPLHAPASGVAGGNGVFKSGASGFPNQSYNGSNYWVDVVFNTQAVDAAPPVVIDRSPAAGATNASPLANVTASFGEPVTPGSISFQLRDASNALVPAAVSYDAATRTATLNPNATLVASQTYTAALSGAADTAGNVMAPVSWSFSAPTCPCNIWSSSTTPLVASVSDTSAWELGVKFKADMDGFITGIRFYKGTVNTGTHTGSLWSAAGTLLATTTFSGETSSGWQEVLFSAPVAVTAGTTYVASYHTNGGGFSLNASYFASPPAQGTLLRALSDAESGGNGVYKAGASGFPNQSFNASNYWVDVVYNATGSDTIAPTVTNRSPAPGATKVDVLSPVTATFSEDVTAGSISFVLRDGSTAVVPSSVSYNAATRTVTLTPSAPLALSSTFTATLSGATDLAGNTMSSVSWSFSTPACPCTIWDSSATPAIASVGDTNAWELGVRFRAQVNGYITSIRFYKGPGNTGTHTGSLWSNTGTPLATATFSGETSTGWQQVNFVTPVAVTAGTTYVASYHTNNGGFSLNESYFSAAGVLSSPLRALRDGEDGANGVYRFGASGFPDQTYHAANYWVDVVFSPTP